MRDFLQHGFVDRNLRIKAVDSTWLTVEPIGNAVEIFLAVYRQVRSFGQILAQQPVDILTAAALPRAARIAKVDLNASQCRQLGMARHLLATIVGQSLAHRPRRLWRLGAWPTSQARVALQQHPHRRAVIRPLENIALPMPGKGAVVSPRRSHVDAQHLGQLIAAILSARARHAFAVGMAQASHELATQLAAWHVIDAVGDRLVRDGARGVIRPHAAQCACNLRWRPMLQQKMVHCIKEHGVGAELAHSAELKAQLPHTHVCPARVVAAEGLRLLWPISPSRIAAVGCCT